MRSLSKYGNKKSIMNIIWIIVAIFVLTMGYKVYAKFFGNPEPDPDKKLDPEEKSTDEALGNIQINPNLTTITEVEANSIANLIYAELNAVLYFNHDRVDDLLRPLNGVDILWVAKKFRVKEYKPYWWSSVQFWSLMQFVEKRDLAAADYQMMKTYLHKAGLM
jgi:hypothetical protein